MLYRIQASVKLTTPESLKATGKRHQWSAHLPTFFFDDTVQGMRSARGAAEFALNMLYSVNPESSVTVTAYCTATGDQHTIDHCGWCQAPRRATDPRYLCPTHRAEYAAPHSAPQEV